MYSNKETVIAIYGSHNATVSLAIDGEIKEVIEIERLVGKKNASLFFYPPTLIKNPESTLNWIQNYFNKKYNVTNYDYCYIDVVDLDMIKRVFPSKEYIQTQHHVNHANSSFYQSNHKEALILSFDGGGNDGWFVLFHAKRGETPKVLHNENVNFGVCYSMVGHYINELKHEKDYLIGNLVYAGKLMGLAGYGKIRHEWLDEFEKWYDLPTGLDHINLIKDMFDRLGIKLEENGLASKEDSRDLAATNQYAFEQNTIKRIQSYLDQYPHLPLHITGGGGLNILFNTRLGNEREVFVSPNPSDCGLSVGMLCGHIKPENAIDITYAGPEVFDKDSLLDYIEPYETTRDIDVIINDLNKGKIIGVVRGGAEHGPRALGNRSIICNPSFPEIKDILNAKVKHREWYRPFAPVVRLEDVNEYFELDKESRWMNYCPKVKPEYKEKLSAITHIDGTARVQTVTREQNEWLYDLLTKFKEKTGIGVLLNTSFNIDGKPILNTYKDAFLVFNTSDMDGLILDGNYINKANSIEKPKLDSKLTVVTGLWDLNRPGRDFNAYLEQFEKLLDIDCNLYIYIQKEYEHIVWKKRQKHNTAVRVYELSDIKDMYGSFWDKTQEIRTNPEWYNKTGENGWLKNSPQATLEYYNPIVMSKFSMLHNVTIWDPFESDYFVWLDAGITFSVYEKYFTEHKVLDKMIPHLDSFLFLSYPYDATDEIHGFDYQAMNRLAGETVKYVCRGGLFGGRKDIIKQGNNTYWHLVNNTLNQGYMGTEESIFTLMAYNEPEIYRRYVLDGNGLIVKFTQALCDNQIELEPIPEQRISFIPKNLDTSKLKTSLYMLTFNFPEQVRHTLETYKQHPGWLDKTRKILIDNSNKPEAIEGNKLICEEYGMEHIITGENLGINRGRLLAAEHFQESDSDYYIFLEDDMGIYESNNEFCRNGFRKYIPDLFTKIHKVMLKEEFDFLKLSFTEVYMDNQIQCSWYNVPQTTRNEVWPNYNKLPKTGLDPNCPRTKFNKIDTLEDISYIDGEVYYCNWPMIVSKAGNQKMFLNTKWDNPYEQTWMSYMFMETIKNNLKPAVLLLSPVNHNRINHYNANERREN